MTDTLKKTFSEIEAKANESFLEREEEVHGLLLAVLSGNHIFFVGPPGTAKSKMVRYICDRFTGTYFEWLLTKFTTPEELFGPVDLSGLKSGTFSRITTGKMPETNVAFLDETFKANSAILNSLLSMLGPEKVFHNNGTPTNVPMIFAVGASNELPEEDEALEALYDRFLIRFNLGYIKNREKFLELLTTGGNVQPAPYLGLTELDEARGEVQMIPVTVELIEALADLRGHLRAEGIIVSDRRFVQALSVLKAEAWLRGDTEVGPDRIDVLSHVLWDRTEDARKVRGLCLQVSNPNMFKAQEILEAAEEASLRILDAVGKQDGIDNQGEAIQVSSQLKKLASDLEDLAGKKEGKIADMAKRVRELNREVVRKGVGLDVD